MADQDEAASVADIYYAYRLLLGRKPDPVGFAHYCDMAANGMTVAALRSDVMASSEFGAGRRLARVDLGEGLCAYVDPTEPDFGRHIAMYGHWEAHIVGELRRHLKPGDVVVDVGANVGIMAFHAARCVGATGKVIAFEPNPDNVQCLLHGIVGNGFETISLHACGLSDRRGIFSLAGGSNSALAAARETSRLSHTQIGDDMLAHEDRIALIKMDIEGHEPAALRGLARTLERHRPVLICEFNPLRVTEYDEASLTDFAAHLTGMSHSCVAVEHDGTRHVVGSASDLLDLWQRKNDEAVEQGRLVDGLLHFDMVINGQA